MVSAAEAGGDVSGRPAGTVTASALLRANQTIERLTTARAPIADPAAFLLHRVHTIELWRQSGARVNTLQVGVSLVRGVLRRGHHGANPLRVFEPIDTQDRQQHQPASLQTSTKDTAAAVTTASAGGVSGEIEVEKERKGKSATATPVSHSLKGSDGASASSTAAAAAQLHQTGTTHTHNHHHHSDASASSPPQPSVARRVLVEAAGCASADLYRGILISFLMHGVSSLTQQQSHEAADPIASSSVSTASQSTSTSAAASTSSSPEGGGGAPLRPTDHAARSNPLSDGRHHTHVTAAATTTTKSAHTKRHLLSSEALQALEEIHRAAQEVIEIMHGDVKRLNVLLAPASAQGGNAGGRRQQTDEDARLPFGAAAEPDIPMELQVNDVCARLTLLTANLYSLLALLDFFSVEAAWAEKTAGNHSSSHHPHAPEKAVATAATPAAAQSGNGFAAGFSSALAAVVSAIADSGSQASGIHHTVPHHTTSAAAAAAAAAHARRKSAAGASSAAVQHTAPLYTVAHFHTLFDAMQGHLPKCIWDVLAAATAVLSQCDVVWSLTHGDAAAGATFNATAAVVFSEAQLSLLRQLHRLCRRFEVLRQRVYNLFPVSPVRFKVKQLIDWGGFLYADDPTYRSSQWDAADLVDMHDGPAHLLYPLRAMWDITAANKRFVHRVASMTYTPPARASASPTSSAVRSSAGASAAAAAAPSMFVVPGADSGASKLPVASLLATLASVGTTTSYGTRRSRTSLFGNAGTGTARSNSSSGTNTNTDAAVKLSTVSGWVGMRNSGNTCFLNSVVQLLSSAALFRANLVSRVQSAVFHHAAAEEDAGGAERVLPMAPTVKVPDAAKLFQRYGCRLALVLLLGELQWRATHHHEEHPVLPDYLDTQLPVPFNDHRQHDASEFLHALLDQLDEPKQPGGAVVGHWFGGQTATTMRCTCCHHARTHVNAFWDLSIPLRAAAPPTTTGATGATSTTPTNTNSAAAASSETHASQSSATSTAGGVVRQVEVEHFHGATATTTTYVNVSEAAAAAATAETAAPTAAGGEERSAAVANELNTSGNTADAAPQPSLTEAAPPSVTLQHLLLHVLHPTLNKELLHGGNALDCEHCKRRTSTALTTQLVAELPTKGVERAEGEQGGGDTQHRSSSAAPAQAELLVNEEEEEDGDATGPTHTAPFIAATGAHTPMEEQGSSAATDVAPVEVDGSPLNEEERPAAAAASDVPPAGTADTAAGAALPWYLAIQLNRFAYQRATQSFAKVTDGVPLNEVVILPAYPIEESTDAPKAPTHQQREDEEEGGDDGSAATPPTAAASLRNRHVLSTPAWVAYRLRSVIVHSGLTPSSGHYFVLTRSGQHNCPAAATADDAAVNNVQAYVNAFGAGLTRALDLDRVFSPFVPPSESVNAAAPNPLVSADVPPAEEEGSCEEDGAATTAKGNASATPSTPPPLPPLVKPPSTDTAPSSPPSNTAAAAAEEIEDAHSPLLTPAPALPAAALSISGAVFYEGWVMLNDSNVQNVTAEKMRHILHGTGGGVYSALETPYVVLYEKLPLSYVHQDESAHDESEEREASGGSEGVAHALALQRVWEDHKAGFWRGTDAATAELAAEAVAIFTSRLHEEEARSHNTTPSGSTAAAAATVAGALVPYLPPTEKTAVKEGASTATQQPSTRTKGLPLRAPSTSAAASTATSNSAKRLRAKAAAYAQQAHSPEERSSRRRLTRGGAAAAQEGRGASVPSEGGEQEEEELVVVDSDETISLD